MNGRPRDYRAEYARRITKGAMRGLSRSQARGHPRRMEAPLRTKPPAFSRQLEAGLRAIKSGQSLSEAARSVHVAPERLRHYLAVSGIAEKRGGRWTVGQRDTRIRQMLLYSQGVAIIANVTPAEADIIGRYMAAVGRFLESNDPAYLAPFAGEVITDTAGRHHPLETDPNALYRLEATGGETFEDVYRIVV